MELKCVHLLIVCLNLLEEKVKRRFSECLDNHRLDSALHSLMKNGRFPEWFSRAFHYDALYGSLGGVRECLSAASANGLLRMDGTHFNYHLELSGRLINYLLGGLNMKIEYAQSLAEELNKELTRMLDEKQPPA